MTTRNFYSLIYSPFFSHFVHPDFEKIFCILYTCKKISIFSTPKQKLFKNPLTIRKKTGIFTNSFLNFLSHSYIQLNFYTILKPKSQKKFLSLIYKADFLHDLETTILKFLSSIVFLTAIFNPWLWKNLWNF